MKNPTIKTQTNGRILQKDKGCSKCFVPSFSIPEITYSDITRVEISHVPLTIDHLDDPDWEPRDGECYNPYFLYPGRRESGCFTISWRDKNASPVSFLQSDSQKYYAKCLHKTLVNIDFFVDTKYTVHGPTETHCYWEYGVILLIAFVLFPPVAHYYTKKYPSFYILYHTSNLLYQTRTTNYNKKREIGYTFADFGSSVFPCENIYFSDNTPINTQDDFGPGHHQRNIFLEYKGDGVYNFGEQDFYEEIQLDINNLATNLVYLYTEVYCNPYEPCEHYDGYDIFPNTTAGGLIDITSLSTHIQITEPKDTPYKCFKEET